MADHIDHHDWRALAGSPYLSAPADPQSVVRSGRTDPALPEGQDDEGESVPSWIIPAIVVAAGRLASVLSVIFWPGAGA